MPGSVPIVDVSDLASEDVAKRRAVGKAIRAIYEELGFLYIAGHDVPEPVVARAFAASARFHALPLETKMAQAVNEWHRGYMPMASSTIVTSSVAKVTRPNLSESLMVMHEIPPGDPEWGKALQGPNRWPADLPGFRDDILAYDAAQRALAERLTRAMALAFDLDEDWFAPHFARPTTWLRLLHYPPHPAQAPDDQFGSAPHTDYGFLTILAQDESGGLQVRGNDGAWIDAPPIPGTFVVNVADILMRWSDGILRSTPHRVRNFSGRARYSLPYFYDPDMNSVVARLPGVNARSAPRWGPVRFGDYVMERLDKNYAYRQRAAG
jgi:isopenicillin N synthase-like dioxygenase